MFIGREDELSFLEEKYQSNQGELVVIYGRRRVGKTETIRKFCEGKTHVFYTCVECLDEQQLRNFSIRMLQTGMPAANYIKSFSDWEQAFRSILEVPGSKKKILVIDEFPYMVKGNSSIPSILQKLWDEVLKSSNIMVILCGSAMAFMEKEILGSKSPLFGRRTAQLHMKPFDYKTSILFANGFCVEEKFKLYGAFGGTALYLQQINNDKNFKQL